MRLYVLLICALLPVSAVANDLLRVYESALTNDTELQAAAHVRDFGIEAKPQARSAYLPRVFADYGYSRNSSELNTAPVPCNAAGDIQCEFNDTNRGLTLTLQQTIFNWESIQRLRQSDDQVALAETSYHAAQQGLVLRVAQAYFNALSAADNLRSIEAENKAVGRQLDQANKRFEVGLSAITDVQDAQARADLTTAGIIAAQQALDSAKEALAVITGARHEKLVPLQDDFPLPAPDPADINTWVSAARENNLQLLAARLNAEIAQTGIQVARAGHLPTLNLQDQYNDGTSGGRFSGTQKQNSIGLQLFVPIYSGGFIQSGVRAASATHEQRKSELEGQKRQVDRQTRDAYQGVLAGAARVKALKQAVLSNTTALQASETGLEVGARTAVDVLNAEQLLYSAQRDYYRARYDYLFSVLTLKSAAGRLSVRDLEEIDRLLVAG